MDNTIKERIRTMREKFGFSQKYVAFSVGVNPSIVSRWESGITVPSRENIQKLAEIFQVTSDFLLGITEEEDMKNDFDLDSNEKKLVFDFRLLNSQGKEYIMQTMSMAVQIYKKSDRVSGMEDRAIGG